MAEPVNEPVNQRPVNPEPDEHSTDPLSKNSKRVLLALVIFFHVGGGYALTLIHPEPLLMGDDKPMEVSFVTETPPAPPEPEPPQEQPPDPPQLESMIEPPPPDLPPPAFPVPPPPPPKPAVKPPPPKPVQQQAQPSPPSPPAAAPPTNTGPKTVAASQVAYLNPPHPVYPARSRRAGEKGMSMIRLLIDASGNPTNVSVQTSSGFPALDEAAVSAVRAARFRPYAEGGVPQAVWVQIPINFVLQ